MKRKQIPCVFTGDFIREQVDPRIKKAYGDAKVPWGDFRRTFKTQYCRRVNPTGHPEDCPFPEEDCAMTFMQVAIMAREAIRPGALFRVIAKNKGIDRADNRPLARDRVHAGRQGDMGVVGGADPSPPDVQGVPGAEAPAPAVPGRTARPASIGSLLGSLNLGARQGPAPDGQEGT